MTPELKARIIKHRYGEFTIPVDARHFHIFTQTFNLGSKSVCRLMLEFTTGRGRFKFPRCTIASKYINVNQVDDAQADVFKKLEEGL